jgi:DNA-binding NarL/FixJ family response regulator
MTSERLRVYLVEDSPIVCSLLEEFIEATGATVVGHADSAPEALSDIISLHPDAAIIDIALRIGSGFDILEAMAINEEMDSTVPIVLTNHAIGAYRTAARELGVKHFFDKTTEIEQAVELLSRPGALRSGRLAA